MKAQNTDYQLGLYFRRRELGLRMLAHGARPQTVLLYTQLTPDQLSTLRAQWGMTGKDRKRGPSPSSYAHFFTSVRTTNEAALFAALCERLGMLPRRRGEAAVNVYPSVETGELLCEALEWFKEIQPNAPIDIEKASLILLGLVANKDIKLVFCESEGCGRAMLVYLITPHRPHCAECLREIHRNVS